MLYEIITRYPRAAVWCLIVPAAMLCIFSLACMIGAFLKSRRDFPIRRGPLC